jgi:hypothetical protein
LPSRAFAVTTFALSIAAATFARRTETYDMARSRIKVMGPTSGRKRVRKMGMNSGKVLARGRNKKPKRGRNV